MKSAILSLVLLTFATSVYAKHDTEAYDKMVTKLEKKFITEVKKCAENENCVNDAYTSFKEQRVKYALKMLDIKPAVFKKEAKDVMKKEAACILKNGPKKCFQKFHDDVFNAISDVIPQD